jgi:glycosyltransferase involved in cell wall biosynthesis
LVNGGLPETSIHVIPHGVDTYRFSFQPAEVFALRRQFQLGSGAPLCGVLGAGSGERSLERDMALVRRIRFQFPQSQFVLLAEDATCRSSVTWQRGVSEWRSEGVHVVSDPEQLPRILPALNVLAVPSRARVCPLIVWQAMASQVPVVAARPCEFGSLHEVGTEHGVTVTDGDELPCQIVQLISDPHRARHLGEKARQFILQHRSLDLMVRRYERLIVDIHQRKRSGPGAALPASLHDTVEFCGAAS